MMNQPASLSHHYGVLLDFIFILATLYFHSIKLKKNPSKVFSCRHGVTAHAHTLEGLPYTPPPEFKRGLLPFLIK